MKLFLFVFAVLATFSAISAFEEMGELEEFGECSLFDSDFLKTSFLHNFRNKILILTHPVSVNLY